MKPNYLIAACCAVFILLTTACTKKNDPIPEPNSKILAYTISLPENDIHGVVDDLEKTVTVYIPLQYGLTFIEPKITLSPGATIKDAPQRIDIQSEGTTYVVKGSDNSTTTYKLVIIVQQKTPLVVDELSTDDIAKINIGSSITITGNFERTLFDEVKMTLIAADGKETILSKGGEYVSSVIKADGKIFYSIDRQMPLDMQPGVYKVRVKFLKLTIEMKKPIELVFGRPGWLLGNKIVNQGETFIIERSYNSVFKNFKEFSIMVNGVKTLLPIVSYTLSEAVIRVPENVPPGDYIPTALFDGFPPKTGFSYVTVREKVKN
ncbi:hypothetical protein HDF26_001683 [Pedobacter cryoconitis]|uniref:hypothetical protein n=1 Tax=Pedobacter cryoconitis TaxID=188932 RepID=UPI00161DD2FD|nr:hypothetical protein [Pedobacter cryoconitis]MBB6271256.1 hypothetical protein [Pedobacter cryoconitis]